MLGKMRRPDRGRQGRWASQSLQDTTKKTLQKYEETDYSCVSVGGRSKAGSDSEGKVVQVSARTKLQEPGLEATREAWRETSGRGGAK